nr:cj cadherin [Hymenolepis microstoma]
MMRNILLHLAICLVPLLVECLNEYPRCMHGGIRQTVNGRTFCECPRNRVNTGPLCEAVRVSFENLQNPLTVPRNLALSFPLHISVEFISKDYRGTGGIFSLGDETKGSKITLSQKLGKPVIGLDGIYKTANVASLHDNQWHRLDLFISKTPISVEIVIVVDHCVKTSWCSQRLIFNGLSTSTLVDGPLVLNIPSSDGNRLQELCLENIVINSQLIDLWEATQNRPLARGCPKCEEACYFTDALNATNKCGDEGVCRNPIVAATDQYVCTCHAGYQPVIQKDQYTRYRLNASAPCVQPSSEWLVTGPVSINIQNNHGFTLILGLRTRQRNTAVIRSRDGMLRLDLENGTLELLVDASPLPLPGIDIADGMWHMIRLTVTPILADTGSRMVELVVDGLWRTFYNASLLPTDSSSSIISDGVLIIEAVSSCLSDVRLEVRDSRNNIYHDYLINEYTEMRQAFLKKDCESEDLCALSNPCRPSEVCISEWQGFRCECKPGYVRRLVPPAVAPSCVLNSCTPNPCLNGGECFILENETLSWENETVAVLCGCSGGWTGLFCELPPLAKSGLQNWWLIPVFFVLILIVFWVVFCVCWFKRKKLKKKKVTSSVVNGPCFVEQQERMTPNGVAKAGEEDYRGYLNLSALKLPEVAMRPGHLTVRGASIETRNADSMLSAEGERFLAMDEPLQYAFEGYDSSPPPTYFFNNGSSRPNGGSRYDFPKNTP